MPCATLKKSRASRGRGQTFWLGKLILRNSEERPKGAIERCTGSENFGSSVSPSHINIMELPLQNRTMTTNSENTRTQEPAPMHLHFSLLIDFPIISTLITIKHNADKFARDMSQPMFSSCHSTKPRVCFPPIWVCSQGMSRYVKVTMFPTDL